MFSLCLLPLVSKILNSSVVSADVVQDKYLGFFITAAVQVPGYFYVILTLERPGLGRKRSMCGFLLVSGLALLAHPLVPAHHPALSPNTLHNIRITLSIIGRFAANCSYTILNLFSAEQVRKFIWFSQSTDKQTK